MATRCLGSALNGESVNNFGILITGSSQDTSDINIKPAGGKLQLTNIGEGLGKVLTSSATGMATWETLGTGDFSGIPNYANNAAAYAAIGAGKLYYVDVAGEWQIYVSH